MYSIRTTAILAFLAVLAGSVPAARAQLTAQDTYRVGPGEIAIYEINIADGIIRYVDGHARAPTWALTLLSLDALQTSPAWIRPALREKLGRLPSAIQDMAARTVLDAFEENPLFVDEVAFTVAYLPEEDFLFYDTSTGLTFDFEILLENVRHIYAADPLLPYVELIDVGDPTIDDDFHTTARYQILRNGNPETYDLPRDAYYWWVVHPRTNAEDVVYVHPSTNYPASRADGGRFWREYLLANRGTPNDPTRPWVMRVPQTITDGELNNWSPSAQGYITSRFIDPIPEVVRSDGRAVMLRISYHPETSGGGYNGTVYATTMPVERAYQDGSSDLLANMVQAGDGNVRIMPAPPTNRVLVLKDRDPFGQATVEEVLTNEGYSFDVMDSTGFSQLATWQDLDALGYEKVIVPSDQPRQFYQRLSTNRAVIDGWVGRSSATLDWVYEFHGAVDMSHLPQDDWTDLVMPGDIEGHELNVNSEDLTVWGYPRVLDLMPSAAEVWDGNRYPGMSGDRTLAATAFALDRLGYMVSQNLDDNVAELPQDYKGPDGDCPGFCVIRSLNAVRVAYGHYENCGGIGILITAMGRTSLIPAVKVSGGPEDHEWNEIFMDDQWRPYQVDWSDGATRIDNPGNGQDRDFGGGKHLSMVYTFRGDGLLINNMDRYSHTVTFSIDVTDASGIPVDGAALLLATEGHYDPYGLMLATIEVTDLNGHVEFPVGDHQNYYLRIDSPAGWWPDHPDDPHVEWIACSNPGDTYPDDRPCPEFTRWDDTLPMPTTDATGEVIHLDLVLDGTGIPLLNATPPQQPVDATGAYRLTLDLDVTHTARELPSLATAVETDPGGELGVMVLDRDNFNRLLADQPLEPVAMLTVGDASAQPVLDIQLPDTSETWYLLLENTRRAGTSYHYDMNLTFHTHQDAGVDGGTGGSGKGGCGCRSADGVPAGLPVLFIFVLGGLWIGRRRDSGRRNS